LRLQLITGKLAFPYMDAVLQSFIGQSESKKTLPRKTSPKTSSRYNFEELQKKAFENINKINNGGGC